MRDATACALTASNSSAVRSPNSGVSTPFRSERLGDYSYSAGVNTTQIAAAANELITGSTVAMTTVNHYRNTMY